MTTLSERTIADLVNEDYRRATVFKKHGIDFCCGGGKTLEAVCEKKGLPLEDMQHALAEVAAAPSNESMRPAGWSPDFLADYIVNEHHAYVRESVPLLQEFTLKVARVHGESNPDLIKIAMLVDELALELMQHMVKEEKLLFPYIRVLVAALENGRAQESPVFETIHNPIRMMEEEHDRAGEMMREIRRLSSDYTPPEHACNTYRVSFAKLEEFENDLHRHVHLENNVLFPKAVALEAELAARRRSK